MTAYANGNMDYSVMKSVLRLENGKYYSYPVHFELDNDGRWGVYGY